jgi:signal transduction histidine kinase
MKWFKFKSIYTKFVFIITGILLLSSAIAFAVMSGFTVQLMYEPLASMMQKKVDELDMLVENYDFTPSELSDIAGNSFMSVKFYGEAHQLIDANPTISSEGVLNIDAGKVETYMPEKILHQRTSLYLITKIDGHWVMIQPVFNSAIFEHIGKSLRTALLLSMLITIALVLVVLKQIVKPMKRLTEATKQVAVGNFDVQVKQTTHDEVGILVMNFNKMTQELKNNEYLKKDFVSSVSHEFKTPIASISGFAKIIQSNDIDDGTRREYVQIIIDETDRLSKLSSNLLRLSSLENQAIIEKMHRFSLDEQIRRVILLLEQSWSKKDLELDLDLEALDFQGDEEMLQQVWINLIDNAIKFSESGGLLSIKVYSADRSAIVEIRDSGKGMDARTVARIFEKFYQGDVAHKTDGNGLGLSIVKRIVDLYDGEIACSSQLGHGTTFTIKLPLNDL